MIVFSDKDSDTSENKLGGSPRVLLSRVPKAEDKDASAELESQSERSKSPMISCDIPYGCGRRGISKDLNPNLVTPKRRVHIVLVAAALAQARIKVAKSRRGSGRARKANSDDPWAGGLSPSAKAFTYQPPKLSPRSGQNRNSIKIKSSTADKRANKKDESQSQGKNKQVKREGSVNDLEVKIVPKFPTDGSAPRTFRNQAEVESDDETDDGSRKRRGRPKKYTYVSILNPDLIQKKIEGQAVISPKTSASKKVTIIANSPVKNEITSDKTDTGKVVRRSLPNETKDFPKKDRKSLPGLSTKGRTVKEDPNGKLVSQMNKHKMPKEDGSIPSHKLLKSKIFKETPAYDAPLIRDVDAEYRAVTVQNVVPTHVIKATSLTGYKLSSTDIRTKPCKVVLTQLEVSPEEALNRLFVIEALLKKQKGKRTAKAATWKARAKVTQEQAEKVRPPALSKNLLFTNNSLKSALTRIAISLSCIQI